VSRRVAGSTPRTDLKYGVWTATWRGPSSPPGQGARHRTVAGSQKGGSVEQGTGLPSRGHIFVTNKEDVNPLLSAYRYFSAGAGINLVLVPFYQWKMLLYTL